MPVNTSDLLFDREVVTELSQKNNEPAWMLERRLQALELASELPLPKPDKTSIRFWNLTKFAPYTAETVVSEFAQLPEAIRTFVGREEGVRNLVVQHHSSVVYSELAPEVAAQGVILTDLHSALTEHGALMQKYFMSEAVRADEHRLTALHGALWSGGVFLYVPKNVEVSLPIQSLFWTDRPGVGVLPHVLIVAEANSKVTFVDNYLGDDEVSDVVHNGVTEIFAGDGAHVQYATLHHYGAGVRDVSYRRAVVGRDAHVEWILGELNNGDTISDNDSLLAGQGSSSVVKTLAVGSGKQTSNMTSRIRHEGKHSESNILARVVMKDEATGIVNSVTKIEKGASKSDGEQTGRVLMLDEKARGDANPILLIEENDVIAGHAASAGQIDPLQIYYLMSRGISKADAERLIVYGFLNPLLAEIPIPGVIDHLQRVIERKLR
ncbi:Fe-S cluster assembly protein SufD [Numidum massiliense]|uniref:Fe-S cluster assembly protein SufD n=1 Tax=Numidum massiliense TaxID=1522315 RepID=UPI0006D5B72C|nr:Fe-S cluster assembly protein SufD [Numidum massiliense]